MPRPFKPKEIQEILRKQTTQQKKPITNIAKTLDQLFKQTRRIREKKMNKTEREFSKTLEKAKKEGQIERWHFEHVTLKLAPNTRYTPDFVAVLPNGRWHIFEIKGHLEDDAAVKFKTACEKFPEISFQMIRRKKGAWETLFNLPSTQPPIDIANPQKTHTEDDTLTKKEKTIKKDHERKPRP